MTDWSEILWGDPAEAIERLDPIRDRPCEWAGETERELLPIRSITTANGEPVDVAEFADLLICAECMLALVSLHERVRIQVRAGVRVDRATYRWGPDDRTWKLGGQG